MNKFMKKKFLLAVLMMSTGFSAISVTGQAEGTSLQSIPQESYDLYGEQTVKEEVKTSIEKALKAVVGLTDQEKEWLKNIWAFTTFQLTTKTFREIIMIMPVRWEIIQWLSAEEPIQKGQ